MSSKRRDEGHGPANSIDRLERRLCALKRTRRHAHHWIDPHPSAELHACPICRARSSSPWARNCLMWLIASSRRHSSRPLAVWFAGLVSRPDVAHERAQRSDADPHKRIGLPRKPL